MFVTFYSFKGGVGRTMAMANVGEILAEWGYRVLLCDWDLEAPGLERYFSPVESPWFADRAAREAYDRYYKEMLGHEGLMELLRDYKETLSKTPADGETPSPEQPDYANVGKLTLRRPSSAAYVPPTRSGDDGLRIMSAGRRENDERLRQYAEEVRDFDWKEFYDKWAGNAYIEFFRKELKGEQGGEREPADIVLVDSRTGVTEQGGVCTHHLADLVVLLSAPNEANVDGTAWMASALMRNDKLDAMRGGRPLAVLPIISRVEVFNEQKLYEDFEEYFIEKLTPYLPKAITEGSEYFKESRIPYVTFYAFRERVVAREARERRQRELYRAYAHVAQGIVRHGLAASLLAADHTPAELRRGPRPYAGRPPRTLRGPVFISHSADDAEVAAMVADALRKRGVNEVLPALSIGVGITADAAQSILPEAGTVFFIVGDNGMSESMRAELDFIVHQLAGGKQTTIVPLLTSSRVFPSPLLVGYRAFVLPPDVRTDAEFFDDLIAEASASSSPAIVSEDARPYPGIAPYREVDARFFFGRDEEIALLEAALSDATASPSRWLRVEGASGIGVSSIVSAGLIPAIRRGAVHGIGRDAVVAVCTAAAADPLLSLASALAIGPATRVEDVRAQIEKQDFAQYAQMLLRGHSAVLVIESLNGLASQPEAVRNSFCAAITALLSASDLPLYVVSTMRCGAATRLTDALTALWREAKVFDVVPIDARRLSEVVIGPAALAGMVFETGLPERIVGEASATTNCPSLLATQLSRLWKAAKDGSSTLITHAMYEKTGGVARLATEMTEEALRTFRGNDSEIAQSILLRLVSGVETRLIRAVVALTSGPEGSQARELVLRRLAEARLLIRRANKDGDEEAELSHDAVLLAPTLAAWIDKQRLEIRQRSELELAARSWKEANKPFGGLPTGGQLRYFEKVETTSPDVGDYLTAARRFTLLRLIGFTFGAILIIFVAAWRVLHETVPEPQKNVTANEVADYYLASGQSMEPAHFLDIALSLRGADPEHTNRLLRAALTASVAPQTYSMDGPIVAFDLSDDGRILALAQRDRIDVYDVATHTVIERVMSKGTLARVTLSSDGSLLFVHHSDRLPEIWRLQPAEIAWHLPGSLYDVGSDAAMTDDGKRAASLDDSGALRIFSNPKSATITSPNPGRITDFRPDLAQRLAFAPGGQRIVAFGRRGSVWVWSSDGTLILNANAHDTKIERSAFSADGRQMVTYTPTNGMAVWDLEGGKTLERIVPGVPNPSTTTVGVAMGADGTPVVLASSDGTLLFHAIPPPGGGDQTAASGHAIISIEGVSGNRFIVAGKGTLEVWSPIGTLIRGFAITDVVTQLSASVSGHAIVVGKLDSGLQLRVWDADAMLTYTALHIKDRELRYLAVQRQKELALTAPPTPALQDAATTRSPENPR